MNLKEKAELVNISLKRGSNLYPATSLSGAFLIIICRRQIFATEEIHKKEKLTEKFRGSHHQKSPRNSFVRYLVYNHGLG